MTFDELERIVIILANQNYCRFWRHWNYPCESPWLMAIATQGKIYEADMIRKGFHREERDGILYWVIERTSVV